MSTRPVLETSVMAPDHPTPGPQTPDASPGPPELIVPGSVYVELPTAPETWLVEPVLPSGGSLLLYGDPKVGKSFAALQLATCLTGSPQGVAEARSSAHSSPPEWLAFACRRSARCAYIQLDTPRSLWSNRILALRRQGFPTDQVWFADRETLGCYPFDILNPGHEAALAQAVRESEAEVVILDTLRECCTGADENDSTDMQAVIAHLTAACQPAAMVLVSHAKKPPAEGTHSVITGNRGSSYIPGRMDAIAHLVDGGLEVVGRACEETTIGLEKVEIPGGFYWRVDRKSRENILARKLLLDSDLPTLRAKARKLAELTGKAEDAALSVLRRAVSTTVSNSEESDTPLLGFDDPSKSQ